VICGVIGTILGLGLYQYFESWIGLLASLVPPLIGPVLVDYYIVHKRRYRAEDLHRLHAWNPAAVLAYIVGAASTFFPLDSLVPSLQGLLVSMIVYWLLVALARVIGMSVGYQPGAAAAAVD
jgi:cytosine permease